MKAAQVDEVRAALTEQRGLLGSVAAFSAAINLLMLLPALYMLQVYDRVLSSGNGDTLLMLTVLVLGLYALMGALEWLRGLLVIRLGDALDRRLAARVYGAAFDRQLAGGANPAAQAVSDLNQVRQFLTGNAIFAFFDAPWAPLYLLVLFLFHPLLGALALVGALLLLALALINERWSRQPLRQSGRLNAEAGKLAGDQIRQAETIQAMGMLGRVRGRWAAPHGEAVDQQHLASERAALMTALTRTLRIALQSLMLGGGAWLAIQGDLTPGMMIAGSILIGRMLAPVEQVVGVWRQWSGTRLAHRRLCLLLSSYPAPAAGLALPAPAGALAVEGLTVVPPAGQRVTLSGLSFSLAAGEILGVVGESGSGKSSLARALVGVWPARTGKVRLDGADLHGWDRERLGPWLGYLPQDVALFAGSVAENIARFGPVHADSVVAAATEAGVHEMILRLPQGYDTVLGDGGAGLSGGQKQRIGLARALYGEPVLLVLDEPNANLDERGEAALAATLRGLKERGRTVVLITHRAGVLACTDKLLALSGGTARAFGPTGKVLESLRAAREGATPAAAGGYRMGNWGAAR